MERSQMLDKEIALVYRSEKNKRYSIETLFKPFDKQVNIQKIILPEDLNSIYNFFKLWVFLLKIKQKVIHITGDVHYVAILLFWKKNIITIHDLNHYENLKGLKKIIYGFIWFYLPLKIAHKIVAISPYTKKQLQNHFKIDENKIIIIPNSFLKFETPNFSYPEKNNLYFQILCVGNTENKNIERLIDAVEGIDKIKIRLIGKQPDELLIKFKNKNINFSIACDLTRNELFYEYICSNILYFASTKEGFGLPILEAQSLGVPVITSNTTAMPFVAGDGTVLVDPYSIESIKESILLFVNGKINLEELKEKGYKNIERFSEHIFFESYNKIYETIRNENI
ncbi:glycosyltransferase [Flavobacterium cellulosilyticum]|uniref:Glycosyltransferase n=1 Tax=Flavobacterium cellulosilyticum TaxID=2541731 RepID=A0A4R5CII1_9FLAO|nr:glycosyltransferase [Flavobacterium cellulosilyticum]TDD98360.1 glycosyltransferase [Flavobacterium cellulosilyticum]